MHHLGVSAISPLFSKFFNSFEKTMLSLCVLDLNNLNPQNSYKYGKQNIIHGRFYDEIRPNKEY